MNSISYMQENNYKIIECSNLHKRLPRLISVKFLQGQNVRAS